MLMAKHWILEAWACESFAPTPPSLPVSAAFNSPNGDNTAMRTELLLTRTTKNTARYDAPDVKNESGKNVTNSVYINLKAFDGDPPSKITVELDAEQLKVV